MDEIKSGDNVQWQDELSGRILVGKVEFAYPSGRAWVRVKEGYSFEVEMDKLTRIERGAIAAHVDDYALMAMGDLGGVELS